MNIENELNHHAIIPCPFCDDGWSTEQLALEHFRFLTFADSLGTEKEGIINYLCEHDRIYSISILADTFPLETFSVKGDFQLESNNSSIDIL